jgi:AcrR family transcriptional regulator
MATKRTARTPGPAAVPPAAEKPAERYLDRPTLIRAAADLADEHGWNRLTLSLVARTVHRHVTSLYAHVDSLDALRRDVALLAADELAERVWTVALGRTREDALRAITEVYRAFSREHPGRAAAMLSADHRNDPEMQQKGRRLAEPIHATFRSFGLVDDQVVQAHRVFSSAVRGLGQAEAANVFPADGLLDETVEQMIRLFVVALESGQWPAPDAGNQ